MTHESDPNKPEFGKGAAGNDHWAVQMAQSTDVNPPDMIIPGNVDIELNKKQVEAVVEQEQGTDLKTTDGYVIDEAGKLNNFAVEPPMYAEVDGKRVELE